MKGNGVNNQPQPLLRLKIIQTLQRVNHWKKMVKKTGTSSSTTKTMKLMTTNYTNVMSAKENSRQKASYWRISIDISLKSDNFVATNVAHGSWWDRNSKIIRVSNKLTKKHKNEIVLLTNLNRLFYVTEKILFIFFLPIFFVNTINEICCAVFKRVCILKSIIFFLKTKKCLHRIFRLDSYIAKDGLHFFILYYW